MLSLRDVHVTIQSAPVLRGVTLEVGSGELVGLIGRNGAGKTSTMRTIVGLMKAARGQVLLDGGDITVMAPHKRTRLGVGYMPEDRRLVPQLSVEENMLLPAWENKAIPWQRNLDFIYDLMPELVEMRERKALMLSGGQQKMVALGRALMAGSRLLLLDEPFEGVARALSQRLAEVIANLRAERRSILMAQSELAHSSELDREYVIARGAIESG